MLVRRDGGVVDVNEFAPIVGDHDKIVLQEFMCNFYFFQKRLCKMWDVNYYNSIRNTNPVFLKKKSPRKKFEAAC
jgi:hypothetical protein